MTVREKLIALAMLTALAMVTTVSVVWLQFQQAQLDAVFGR